MIVLNKKVQDQQNQKVDLFSRSGRTKPGTGYQKGCLIHAQGGLL